MSSAVIQRRIEMRRRALVRGDHKSANRITAELMRSGVTVSDSAAGTRWQRFNADHAKAANYAIQIGDITFKPEDGCELKLLLANTVIDNKTITMNSRSRFSIRATRATHHA